jgi:hypothetical protein
MKLDTQHWKVPVQLPKLIVGLRRVVNEIDQYLLNGHELPQRRNSRWPVEVISLEISEDCENVLFVPTDSPAPLAEGWVIVPNVFSYQEVLIIADFLWELDREERR